MRNLLYISFIFSGCFAIVSCKTDIDVNAEYKDITVVYGLINPNDTNHYIKINKAFLGDENALNLAANADNFNYKADELSVVVEEFNSQGNKVASHNVTRTVNEIPKDEGIFDNSTNVLYKFTSSNIDRNNKFKITIYNSSLNKEIVGETEIVKTSNVSNPSKGSKFAFWNGDLATGIPIDKTIEVDPGEDVGRVEAIFIFNYIEHYTIASGKSPVTKSIEMKMGDQKTVPMQWEMKGETFFDNIVNAIPANVADLSHRELLNISMRFNVAGTELNTFMDVEAPSNSINQEKPNYTNLTNALGIFSSREVIIWESTISGSQVNLNNSTIKHLNDLGLGFCFGSGGTAVAPCNQI